MIGSAGRLFVTELMQAALGSGPPINPDRELARDWARQELSDPIYDQGQPGLIEQAFTWVQEQVSELAARGAEYSNPTVGIVLLLLALAVTVIVIRVRTGRLRGPGRQVPTGAMFAGTATRSAAEHRQLADAAARAQDWALAIQERYRAIVRSLEERVIIDERPGRTADEAALEAGRLLPNLATDLTLAAASFDDVTYGKRPGTADHDAALRQLTIAVERERPRSTSSATPSATLSATSPTAVMSPR